MITGIFDDVKEARPATGPVVSQDPWEDWKPDWSPLSDTPHARQEKFLPTESVSLRLTSARTETRCQRRIVDARLWEAMTAQQQQAALQIALAFETMGKGLGYAQSNWQRIPGARSRENVADAHARLIGFYIDWTKACHREKISHSMVIDVLAFGFSCSLIDRDRKVRTGTTRGNLMAGLDLYVLMRGWPQ